MGLASLVLFFSSDAHAETGDFGGHVGWGPSAQYAAFDEASADIGVGLHHQTFFAWELSPALRLGPVLTTDMGFPVLKGESSVVTFALGPLLQWRRKSFVLGTGLEAVWSTTSGIGPGGRLEFSYAPLRPDAKSQLAWTLFVSGTPITNQGDWTLVGGMRVAFFR
jgi:hypothetical protein